MQLPLYEALYLEQIASDSVCDSRILSEVYAHGKDDKGRPHQGC